jgi:hypothetical protein
MEVAQALTQEVAAVLGESPEREVTASWVSQVVEQRLRNRGILGLAPEPKATMEPVTSSPEDETQSLSKRPEDRTRGLLQKGQSTRLPTLEKFLLSPQTSPTPQPVQDKTQPPPPRAEVKIHPMTEAQTLSANAADGGDWPARLASLAQRAAAVEGRWTSPVDPQTLEVEFYNAMANQEFYPHAPELLPGQGDWQAKGATQLWMDLPLGAESVEVVLGEAKKAWGEGAVVSFILREGDGEAGFSAEGFEGFLCSVEKALLELPEQLPPPPIVGLHLEMGEAQALVWARLALSGKFYPKFSVCLSLPRLDEKFLEINATALQDLRHRGSLLFHRSVLGEATDSTSPASYPRWGGGPELEPCEFCQLGSLNLSIVACGRDVDWVKLRRIVRSAVHFLDNLIEAQTYPLEAIAQRSRANRKIGLGVMGFAELLGKLGIPYQSEQAAIVAEKTVRFIQHEALEASHQLAKARGVFPNYSRSRWKALGRKVRHRNLTAVCPAPDLAALAGVTPGIDPAAAAQGETSPLSLARMQAAFERPSDGAAGICYELSHEPETLSEFLTQTLGGGLRQVQLAQDLRPRLVTLREDPVPELPTTEREVEPRDEQQILQAIETENTEIEVNKETTPPLAEATAEEEVTETFSPPIPRPTPEILEARIHRMQTFHGEMKVTLGFDPHGPYELSARVGKAGSEVAAQAEALSRLISLLFSVGVEPQRIYRELRDIQCVTPLNGAMGTSIPDGLAQIISLEFPETPATGEETTESENQEITQEEVTEILEAGTIH